VKTVEQTVLPGIEQGERRCECGQTPHKPGCLSALREGQKEEALALNELNLLQLALSKDAAIDVIERLAALQREAREREAMIDFNDALNRVQEQIKRIAPDLENPSKKSRYASYAAIDRIIRPIYSKEGFGLSFTHADCPKADHIRVVARLSLRAHVEHY